MKLRLKLYATLGDYLPSGVRGHETTLDIGPETTVQQVIDRLGIPEEQAHLVLVDGVYVEPQARSSRVLREGEVLAIWPPVAGG
ncbi:MAG: MoaD/ThiS family protein [Gammaproteobacteria bacterium]|nr:MAG: MoaD/ThiS family protein [Gammaproteobacteria bacterium]